MGDKEICFQLFQPLASVKRELEFHNFTEQTALSTPILQEK